MSSVLPPNFLRKEPTVDAKQNDRPAVPLTPQRTANAVEAANQLGAHMERLERELITANADIDFLRKHNAELQARLDIAEASAARYEKKAEFFERFSMTIAANFANIRMVIDATQRKADEFARSNEPITPPAVQELLDKSTPAQPDLVTSLEQAIRGDNVQ